MPRYIKPYAPKPIPQPSDPLVRNDTEFRLDASEIQMFDHWAQEHTNASSTEIELYELNRTASTVDPLYSEVQNHVYDGPYVMMGHVEWPEFTPENTEDGFRAIFPSGVWIPRKTIEEAHARSPREGDIVRFWKLPYFSERSIKNEDPETCRTQGGGYFFDVVKVVDDGHIFDNPEFVGFRCVLKRRTVATPEIKLTEKPADPVPEVTREDYP